MCVSAGKAGLSRSEQLVGYFIRAPSRRGLLSGLALTCAVFATASGQPSLFASAHAGAANSLDAANQCVSNGHSL